LLDHGEAEIENRALRLSTKEGDSSALLVLGGTERWADASLEVQLAGPPKGQFWISLRGDNPSLFVRLGVVDGRAVIQRSEPDGETRQLASRELERGDITLQLRMVGSRALAELNGRPLGERPVAAPEGMREGPMTVAVWDPKGGASVRIRSVKATPLRRLSGIIAATPGGPAWDALRQRVDELAVLSPRYFIWQAGGGRLLGERDNALQIFARFHYLQFLPAVSVDGRLSPARSSGLADQAARWASEPGFDGLNLVIEPANGNLKEWLEFAAQLRKRLSGIHKVLAVTVAGSSSATDFKSQPGTFVLQGHPSQALEVATAPLALVKSGA
jgi:hypothetical protein